MKTLYNKTWCLIFSATWLIAALTGCLRGVHPNHNRNHNHNHSSVSTSASTSPSTSAVLLLAQAQFRKGADGKTGSIPGAAKLTLVRETENGWESSLLEDPQSNVFHKALWFTPPAPMTPMTPPAPAALPSGKPGILTIGGNEAALKLWHRDENDAGKWNGSVLKWKGSVLWNPTFGGEQNRLRDIELGDVTGDGLPDMVIATHDQGVIAVLQWKNGSWEVTELDRTPDTFVHEIEIGDVNRDGVQEFFATPSAPNRLDGTPQPGKIIMYHFDGEHFVRSTVEEFPRRHVKEILSADVTGSGYPDLFAALEGEMAVINGQPNLLDTVKIKQYRFVDGRFSGQIIADLPDMLCRNLTAGDVDGDGTVDIVVSTMRSGIWILRQKGQVEGQESWEKTLIDAKSSGFEHATLIADLNHDGRNEIYVASDDQQVLRRYQWNGENFQPEDLLSLQADDITFGLTSPLN